MFSFKLETKKASKTPGKDFIGTVTIETRHSAAGNPEWAKGTAHRIGMEASFHPQVIELLIPQLEHC